MSNKREKSDKNYLLLTTLHSGSRPSYSKINSYIEAIGFVDFAPPRQSVEEVIKKYGYDVGEFTNKLNEIYGLSQAAKEAYDKCKRYLQNLRSHTNIPSRGFLENKIREFGSSPSNFTTLLNELCVSKKSNTQLIYELEQQCEIEHNLSIKDKKALVASEYYKWNNRLGNSDYLVRVEAKQRCEMYGRLKKLYDKILP